MEPSDDGDDGDSDSTILCICFSSTKAFVKMTRSTAEFGTVSTNFALPAWLKWSKTVQNLEDQLELERCRVFTLLKVISTHTTRLLSLRREIGCGPCLCWNIQERGAMGRHCALRPRLGFEQTQSRSSLPVYPMAFRHQARMPRLSMLEAKSLTESVSWSPVSSESRPALSFSSWISSGRPASWKSLYRSLCSSGQLPYKHDGFGLQLHT